MVIWLTNISLFWEIDLSSGKKTAPISNQRHILTGFLLPFFATLRIHPTSVLFSVQREFWHKPDPKSAEGAGQYYGSSITTWILIFSYTKWLESHSDCDFSLESEYFETTEPVPCPDVQQGFQKHKADQRISG